MDEVYIVTVRGERRYLWRAVDQESLPHERSECFGYGDVFDILVQKRKDKWAAAPFVMEEICKLRVAVSGFSSRP